MCIMVFFFLKLCHRSNCGRQDQMLLWWVITLVGDNMTSWCCEAERSHHHFPLQRNTVVVSRATIVLMHFIIIFVLFNHQQKWRCERVFFDSFPLWGRVLWLQVPCYPFQGDSLGEVGTHRNCRNVPVPNFRTFTLAAECDFLFIFFLYMQYQIKVTSQYCSLLPSPTTSKRFF